MLMIGSTRQLQPGNVGASNHEDEQYGHKQDRKWLAQITRDKFAQRHGKHTPAGVFRKSDLRFYGLRVGNVANIPQPAFFANRTFGFTACESESSTPFAFPNVVSGWRRATANRFSLNR